MVLRRGTGWIDLGTLLIPHPDLLAGEEQPAQPCQKRSIEKRERLKTAALACFGELGYEGTSIEVIARRAGMAVGGFYQHYRSKRQLLLALMDELLHHLEQLNLKPKSAGDGDIRAGLHDLLEAAFSHDLRYLGACRAWQEAVLSDAGLARKQAKIHTWTTARITAVFQFLAQLPGARTGIDLPALARVMDSFFWNLLAQAVTMPEVELKQWIGAATHLIYHAIFTDTQRRPSSRTSRAAKPRSPSSGRRSPR